MRGLSSPGGHREGADPGRTYCQAVLPPGTHTPPAALRDAQPDRARGRTPLPNPEGRPRRHSPPPARPDWPRRRARVMARAACALAAGPAAGEWG